MPPVRHNKRMKKYLRLGLNEKIGRSVAIGWIDLVNCLYFQRSFLFAQVPQKNLEPTSWP